MAIPRNKSRVILTLKDYTKSCIEYLSENDKRTPSMEIEYIIEHYISQLEKSNEDLSEYLDNYYSEVYKPKEISNSILSYWKQSTRSFFARNRVGTTLSEARESFENLLLKDTFLQKDFVSFNGEENKVLNFLEKTMFETNIDFDTSKYITDTVLKIFLGI